MAKWKKTWKNNHDNNMVVVDETVEMKNKMKKMRKRHENPKNIVEFDNIYERPQPSSIIEGMEDKNDGTLENIKESVDNTTQRFSTAFDPKKTIDPITGLENQLCGIGTALDDLQGFQADFESMCQTMSDVGKGIGSCAKGTAEVFKNIFDFDQKSIQSGINEASTTVGEVTNVIKFVINLFGKKLAALRLQIQIFLLKTNRYVKQTITRMANALTGNTATESEIAIFQTQTQKFITLLLVWYFVYNWYYIIFFLEDSDNVRYTFKVEKLKNISKYLYGFFGPGLKPIEKFNAAVISCQNLKKYSGALPDPMMTAE